MPNNSEQPSNLQILKISPTLNSFWYKAKFRDNFLYVHYDDLTLYNLTSGKSLSYEEFENLYNLYLKRKTQEKALARLAIKPRSNSEMRLIIKEIIYKLNNFNKHTSSADITNKISAEIIQYLIEKGYLNDIYYAENIIKKYLTGTKLKGPNYIKSLLMQKGISPESINKLMIKYYTDSNENDFQNALLLAKKYSKKRKYANADPNDKKAMLTRYLAGQGYTFEAISQVLKES